MKKFLDLILAISLIIIVAIALANIFPVVMEKILVFIANMVI